MHLSIGLHTSAGKSYPQPLQPAKHRGIALDINQRLRTDRTNYLSKARSGGSFFTPQRGKYPPAEGGKRSPIHKLLKPSKRQLISGVKSPPSPQQNNRLYHSIIATPPQIKKATTTGQQANQYYSPYRTSTANTSEQHWPHNRYRSTRAELYRMAKKAI